MANDFMGPGDFTGVGNDALDSAANDQVEKTAAWIAPDKDAPPGCGRIMLTRSGAAENEPDPVASVPQGFAFLSKMFGILSPDSPQVVSNIAVKAKSAANDNVIWVGDEDADGDGGVYGSDVDAATLADGSSVIAWIGPDRVVHAKYYPADDAHGANAGDAAARAEHVGQINALLADLGGAGQRAGNADGRVKVTGYGQGGVAALWIADFGFTAALMGKLYMLQQDPAGDEAAHSAAATTASWAVKDIPPVAVPRFASGISIDISDDGRVSVSYQSEPGDGGSAFGVTIDTQIASGSASEDDVRGSDGGDMLAPSAEASGLQVPQGSSAPVKQGNADSAEAEAKEAADDEEAANGETEAGIDQGPAPDDDMNAGTLAPELPDIFAEVELTGAPVIVAGAGDGVAQSKPQVVVTPGGNPISLHVEPGTAPGTAVIKLTPLGSDGHPITNANGEAVVTIVTDHAVVADQEKPYLELNPSLAVVGEGVGVAFVTESGDGAQAVYQLNVQVFDAQGTAVSDTPTVVALASDHATSYSDFDVSGVGGHAHSEGGEAQTSDDAQDSSSGDHQGGCDVQLAVVWVENANENGYGSIMGQRFGVVNRDGGDTDSGSSDDNAGSGHSSDGGLVLVALGQDGSADVDGGGGDAAFHLSSETTEDVIGRAPQVSGCGDDDIAVAWVQESSPGSGVEVIAGAVMQASSGHALLAINLTGLINHGIVAGSEPTLLSDSNGDIVIGWVQSGNSGQYEAAVAIYRALEAGGWTVPDAATVLRTFESLPMNLDFGLQGGDDPTILLSWSGDRGRISGVYFDLDGTQDGSVFRIHAGDDDIGTADGDVSIAGLSNGQIVVVYTQADGDDTSIAAMVVQAGPSSESPLSGGGSSDSTASDSSSTSASSSDLDPGSISSMIAMVVATPSEQETDNCGSGDSSDAGPATGLVVMDLESDLIRVFDSAGSYNSAVSGSNSAHESPDWGTSSNSGTGSSNSGPGNHENAVAYDDGNDLRSGPGNGRDFSDDQGCDKEHLGGGGSPGSGHDGGDNLAIAAGYGNDVADYYEDEHVFDVTEPIVDMFDALQFANALSENGNGEVIVFEASNLVVIRDFETL